MAITGGGSLEKLQSRRLFVVGKIGREYEAEEGVDGGVVLVIGAASEGNGSEGRAEVGRAELSEKAKRRGSCGREVAQMYRQRLHRGNQSKEGRQHSVANGEAEKTAPLLSGVPSRRR